MSMVEASTQEISGVEIADKFRQHELSQDGVDLSLLKISLAKTPWERMQANDDAWNFAESLRTAVKFRRE